MTSSQIWELVKLADAKRALRTHPSRYTYLTLDDDNAFYEVFLALKKDSANGYGMELADIVRSFASANADHVLSCEHGGIEI